MDFALKQMRAMGWSEGKGLGLSENGITAAIKPNTQMDTRGFGFTVEDSIQLKNQWWSEAYNAASKGLKAEYKITSVGVVVKTKKQTLIENEEECEEEKKVYNNHFVSAGVMAKENDSLCDETTDHDIKKKKKKKRKSQNDELNIEEDSAKTDKPNSINFNDVFHQSRGMTCHKAARLGIKMNGKMKRIEEQEQEFLKKFKKC